MAEVAGYLPESFGRHGDDEALCALDTANQFILQNQLARHLYSGKKAVVTASSPHFFEGLRVMAPERHFIFPLLKEPRQRCAPRAGAQDSDSHGVCLEAPAGRDTLDQWSRFSVPFSRRLMLAL